MIDLRAFREDKGIDDYYKSNFNLADDEGEIEGFLDNLEDVIEWQEMKKGERNDVGTVRAYCVDITNEPTDSPEMFEKNVLIMLTYDEYPDDTIKLRFNVFGEIFEGEEEIESVDAYYLDSEGQDNPLDYSGFQELNAALKRCL